MENTENISVLLKKTVNISVDAYLLQGSVGAELRLICC